MNSILSMQSHVVHGYVGNRTIQPILTSLKANLDIINLIQFSNHTGYNNHTGEITSSEEIDKLLDANLKCDFNYNGYILGYLSNNNNLKCILKYLKKEYQKSFRDYIVILDPVMGDDNVIYVEQNIIMEYQSLLSNDNIFTNNLVLTPNIFELQLLTNYEEIITKNLKMEDIYEMSNKVFEHKNNLKLLIVTNLNDLVLFNNDKYIYIMCLLRDKKLLFKVPKFEYYFTGVGDLFSGILMYSMLNNKLMNDFSNMDKLIQSINYTLNLIHCVLKLTIDNRKNLNNLRLDDTNRVSINMKDCELKILKSIQYLKDIDPNNMVDYFDRYLS
ncbi:uncharacterized protein HGUI_01253 [Hanseniaspora guilliermondii]|uniref:pyridoxal kinase n=1 Tax=Hanseniaspora guilliermondii TaxID=56406 RepID=A0A1L0CJR8_9ASCO|nr:uncharacterized protein HGUI_01253 [Hanseniaspora guilliermondii]